MEVESNDGQFSDISSRFQKNLKVIVGFVFASVSVEKLDSLTSAVYSKD